MIVRYADDFVMGFEKKADAEEMLLALKASPQAGPFPPVASFPSTASRVL
ncbi:hypothetical protein X726_32680 [Mesorhizobium sp. L103C105A0]|nr:hypothetical protein X726_32680 [Mesorhizobium sp. L103C105A0]